MKKVIITGATSFIGRHLVNILLKRDWKVYAVVRRGKASQFQIKNPKPELFTAV